MTPADCEFRNYCITFNTGCGTLLKTFLAVYFAWIEFSGLAERALVDSLSPSFDACEVEEMMALSLRKGTFVKADSTS